MAKKAKPMIEVVALDVISVTVSAEAAEPALIALRIEGQADLQIRLSPEMVAKLEAMLGQASLQQSKHNPIQ